MILSRDERILREVLFGLHVRDYFPEELFKIARGRGYAGSENDFYGELAKINEYQNNTPTIKVSESGSGIKVAKTGPSRVVDQILKQEEIILGKVFRLGAKYPKSAEDIADLRRLYPQGVDMLVSQGKLINFSGKYYIPSQYHREVKQILKRVAETEKEFSRINSLLIK